MREVDHRAKNMLATVNAIVRMTRADDVETYVDSLSGRLQTLSRAHTLLADNRWEGASLCRVIAEELGPYASAGGERVTMHGPDLALAPEAAQALAMAVHELATNAAKYGALSVPHGQVDIAWRIAGGRFTLDWVERNGPVAQAPSFTGFGTRLMQRTVRDQLDGELRLDWHGEGLACAIVIPRARLVSGAPL
jgi:two-component sensor histidine kinase